MMRPYKIVFSTIILLSFSTFLSAQILIGASAGPNYSMLSKIVSPFSLQDYKPELENGFNINTIIKYRISPVWAVQAEPGFMLKKSEADIKFNTIQLSDSGVYNLQGTHRSRTNYFHLPLLMQYRKNFSNGIVAFANVGIHTSIKLKSFSGTSVQMGAEIVDENGAPYTGFLADHMYIDNRLSAQQAFPLFDYGIVTGIGAAFNTNENCNGILTTEIRVTNSFVNRSGYNLQGPCLQFTLGFITDFKRKN